MDFKAWLMTESTYEPFKKYTCKVPEIKYLPVAVIHRKELDFRPEVMSVSDDVAKKMDYSEPIEVTAFRFAASRGNEGDDTRPEVTLTNGHHRTAAALQTGRKYLPVEVKAINAKGEKLNALIALSNSING